MGRQVVLPKATRTTSANIDSTAFFVYTNGKTQCFEKGTTALCPKNTPFVILYSFFCSAVFLLARARHGFVSVAASS
jgi:hypothetical protein